MESSPPTPAQEEMPPLMVDRYIELPEVLFDLRHRFPCVLKGVFLECTRCHQWVLTDVLPRRPTEEQPTGPASSAAAASHVSRFLAPPTADWHSPRLREWESRAADGGGDSDTSGDGAGSDSEGSGDGGHASSRRRTQLLARERRLLEAVRSAHNNVFASGSDAGDQGDGAVLNGAACKHYMRNPATFVCDAFDCRGADVFADLRDGWLMELLRAAETERDASTGADDPRLTQKMRRQMKSLQKGRAFREPAAEYAALRETLNDALRREYDLFPRQRPNRRPRPQHAGVAVDTDEKNQTSEGGGGDGDTGEGEADRRRAVLGSDFTAYAAARSGGDSDLNANARAEKHTAEYFATALGNLKKGDERGRRQLQRAWVSSAAHRLHLAASTPRELSPTGTVDGPFHRKSSVGGGVAESTDGGLTADEAVTLSAFCWVVCERCGKLRRLAQPYPGEYPFVCALSPPLHCKVDEIEGLQAFSARFSQAELVRIAAASPFLPPLLRERCAAAADRQRASRLRRVLPPTRSILERGGGDTQYEDGETDKDRSDDELGEVPVLQDPLLKCVLDDVNHSTLVGTRPPDKTGTAGAKAATLARARRGKNKQQARQLHRLHRGSLSLLRSLVAALRRRSLGTLGAELLLTPAEVQAKREEVLRVAFLDDVTLEEKERKENDKKAAAGGPDASGAASDGNKRTTTKTPMETSTGANKRPRRQQRQPKETDKAKVEEEEIIQDDAPPAKKARTEPQAATRRRKRTTGNAAEAEAAPEPEVTIVDSQSGSSVAPSQSAESTDTAVKRRGRPPKTSQASSETATAVAQTESETTESANTGNSETAPAKGQRRRGRPPSVDHMFWVQCDRCFKWRLYEKELHGIPAPAYWECKQRVVTPQFPPVTCDDEADDVRMEREEREVEAAAQNAKGGPKKRRTKRIN